ncbi:Gfo/Idh/MocA family oxidoreductase [Marinococcus halophilus]|uniref:Gfo/Idh/MocA family oxidoreductase n=1 Tax=Marinococcus halophilus TaxID=1371 RepID=UPI0009A909C9|nr:Gfo/Idh/MocA family oxidoreductase [Marinococcus halophilus]
MKKLKLGVAGLGKLGIKHARNIAFQLPDAELAAISTRTREKVKSIQKDWQIAYAYTNYEEMIQNNELDAVVIASRSTEHYKQVILALEAGLHVFCEKPLGITNEECNYLQKIAEKHAGQVFMVGFMRRYDPAYTYAKSKIKMGAIGTPFLVRCYSLDPNYLINDLINSSEANGGLFIDMGVHDIDLARWFLESEANSVYALGATYLHDQLKQTNDIDNGTAIIKFENNKIGLFYSGRTAPHGYHIETEIVGTHGTLQIQSIPKKNQVMVYDEYGASHPIVSNFIDRFDNAFKLEMHEFIQAIQENRPPGTTIDDGIKATEISSAANKSLQEQQVMYF